MSGVPVRRCQTPRSSPAARTLMSTSPAAGSGTAASRIVTTLASP